MLKLQPVPSPEISRMLQTVNKRPPTRCTHCGNFREGRTQDSSLSLSDVFLFLFSSDVSMIPPPSQSPTIKSPHHHWLLPFLYFPSPINSYDLDIASTSATLLKLPSAPTESQWNLLYEHKYYGGYKDLQVNRCFLCSPSLLGMIYIIIQRYK